MQKLFCLALILCLQTLALCGCGEVSIPDEPTVAATATINEQQTKINELSETIQDLEQEITEKDAQIDTLKAQLDETEKEYTYPYLPQGVTAEELREDLKKHTELIPFDAALGGTNYFSRIHILSGSNVYATAGDDHRYENLLFEYTVNADGTIAWTLLGRYDW